MLLIVQIARLASYSHCNLHDGNLSPIKRADTYFLRLQPSKSDYSISNTIEKCTTAT